MIHLWGPVEVRYPDGGMAELEFIQVFFRDTSSPAPIFADVDGTPLDNPVRTSEYGHLYFFAEDGLYDLFVRGLRIPIEVSSETGGVIEDWEAGLQEHIEDQTPHPALDIDMQDLTLIFENGLV